MTRRVPAPCPSCGVVHTDADAVAVGRFDPDGPTGYRARAGVAIFATRAEAVADQCRLRRLLGAPGGR